MKFQVLERLSESGDPHNTGQNDDATGNDDRVAIVADGGTGLGDKRYTDHPVSDARWIADLTVERMLQARADDPVRDLVAEIISHAGECVNSVGDAIPRYAWPGTSFIMVRLQQGLVEVSGLGDCVAFVQMDDGFVERFSALEDNSRQEAEEARRDLASGRGPTHAQGNAAIRTPEVLASLRAKREKNNTAESGIWSVSLEPEAADHVMSIALPLDGVSRILLASDGFSAAFDRYHLALPDRFLAAAETGSLAELQAEIRHIERKVDPLCERFPRYKQSDDSTAILLEFAK